MILFFSTHALAGEAEVCDLLLQEKTVTGVGVREYIEAQPVLKARILAHPNGPAFLKNLNTEAALEKVPTEAELRSRLTTDEAKAINGYAGGLSRRINEYCCGPKGFWTRWQNRKTAKYHNNLVSGLAKLDPFEGAVFRDDYEPEAEKHARYLKEGGVITLERFWSSSRKRTRQYGGDTPRRANDLTLVIRSRTGRSIEKIGWIFIDYEVLFAPGARFRVDMVFPRVGGSHLVFMTELAGESKKSNDSPH